MKKPTKRILMGLLLLTGCSGTVPELGIENGQLANCPETPNCVNSQAKNEKHFIEPIQIPGTQAEARNLILTILKEWNRSRIIAAEDTYIRAEFSSRVFGFVDDVEFYFPEKEAETTIVHLRSASRLGYSDLGVNRKRVEQIRSRLNRVSSHGMKADHGSAPK